jgi:hypothetical protein
VNVQVIHVKAEFFTQLDENSNIKTVELTPQRWGCENITDPVRIYPAVSLFDFSHPSERTASVGKQGIRWDANRLQLLCLTLSRRVYKRMV